MSVQINDQIEIPVGTEVFEGHMYHNMGWLLQMTRSRSTRLTKATVGEIIDASSNWFLFMSKEDQDTVNRLSGCRRFPEYFEGRFNGPKTSQLTNKVAEIKAKLDATYGDYKFVVWTKKKAALLSAVKRLSVEVNGVEVAKPKPKKAEQKITKRRQMVVNSIWTFPETLEISMWVDNPEIDRLIALRNKIDTNRNREVQQGNRTVIILGGRHVPEENFVKQKAIQDQINNTPQQIYKHVVTVPAGLKVKVIGKPEAASYSYNKETNGLMVPFEFVGEVPDGLWIDPEQKVARWGSFVLKNGLKLPYPKIEPTIVAEEVPEEITYVIRDTATNEYFNGWTGGHWVGGASYQMVNGEYVRGEYDYGSMKMSSTFSGAKKYKNLAALKASIMDMTGYSAGMEVEGNNYEYWLGIGENNKKTDLPPTWEAIAVDKTTNTEKTTHDLQTWYATLMRLRVLTVKAGPATRAVYKKVEGNKDYTAIISFMFTDDECDDEDKLPDYLLADVKKAMSQAEGKTITTKTPRGVAYAVQSDEDAMLIVLSYNGRGKCKAYSTETLEEVVGQPA